MIPGIAPIGTNTPTMDEMIDALASPEVFNSRPGAPSGGAGRISGGGLLIFSGELGTAAVRECGTVIPFWQAGH